MPTGIPSPGHPTPPTDGGRGIKACPQPTAGQLRKTIYAQPGHLWLAEAVRPALQLGFPCVHPPSVGKPDKQPARQTPPQGPLENLTSKGAALLEGRGHLMESAEPPCRQFALVEMRNATCAWIQRKLSILKVWRREMLNLPWILPAAC